ncbi:TonB-dependent receptor [Actimicrobium sp. CCC2.4]|uniref:TonB-dependent receptor n=1 Tax=Actimicrobium sp. CCC2.4 TaxID=3048606 RepID=UPI002AC994D1|nr:TonB-dependent receptor [Actimicrobium sp. CCC2.4]MEB0136008.1 TonB-dependent receptor [Actimicrobium sp. CCC2.4]WPX32671.1 TonB-dependent receptor [Actimicrobium sp. CCC2.4]
MNPLDFTLSPLALAVLLLVNTTAQAQTATTIATAAPQVLQSITVSASADASAAGLPVAYPGGQVARGGRLGLLGNTDLMDAPFNSTNYTQALIQDQQSHSVADVLQNDPSVRVARGFGNYQELYMIRGFAVSSDDIAYNGLFGLLPRQFVAAELLERVEVFRGANTFLNGAAPGGGGVGGSINLLPKRAGNAPLTQITAGIESGGQAYLATDIGRRFGPENAMGIRINAVRRDGDTAVDREQRSLSVLSVGLDYRTANVRLSADAGFQEHKLTAPRPSVTLAGGIALPPAPDASRNFAQPWTYSNERDTFGTVRGEVDLSKDVVAWAALGARSGNEGNVLTPLTVSRSTGAASLYRFDNQRRDTVRTGEIGVRGTVQTGPVSHSLSATLSGFSLDSRNAYALSDFYINPLASNIYTPVDAAAPAATFFTGGNLAAPLTTRKSNLSSYALADTMSFANDRVLLTIGARNQTIKDVSYDYTSAAETSRYDQSMVTPMAGLVIKPMKDVSVYANYIEGLQQGAVASGNGVTNLGQTFAPYKSKQKEIGIKYDAGTVGMSAAVFTTAQPSAYVRNNVFGVFGEQRNRGLELSVFGTPVRGVRVLGGLTVLDAKQVSTVDGIHDGKDAIGVPRQQFNLGAEWDVPGARGLTLTGRTVVTSSQYADGANTQELPSWTRVGVGARYVTLFGERALTLRARVDNLTDKNYWASAGGYPGAGYLVLGAPRTVVLSASIDF